MSNDEQMRMMIGLQAHVQRLAGDIGERNVFHSAALNDAASYIESEWSRQGYAVSQLMYEVSGVRCANLEVVRDGKARRREILLIGAHYDSVVGSPGANDNGSGVAALLEISRRFVAIEPAMTVRFVAFVNEEPPFFMSKQQGSMVYAKSARHRSDDIRLMASLETIAVSTTRHCSSCSIQTVRTLSVSYVISIPARRCGGWRMLSKHTPTFRCRPRRSFGSFPASPGAITGHFGVKATAP
jgi:Iap family predicted aminopeptidase